MSKAEKSPDEEGLPDYDLDHPSPPVHEADWGTGISEGPPRLRAHQVARLALGAAGSQSAKQGDQVDYLLNIMADHFTKAELAYGAMLIAGGMSARVIQAKRKALKKENTIPTTKEIRQEIIESANGVARRECSIIEQAEREGG